MRKLLSLTLAVLALSANARQISPDEAAAIASEFLNSGSLQRAAGRVDVHRAQAAGSTQTDAPYYVFNAADDKGFAIVAGDDRVPRILGYSDHGTFDFTNLPPQLAALLESYTKQIANLSSSATHPTWNKPAHAADATDGVLLETANWGQGYPYNLKTPVVDGEHCPTGCVATAMAIVMKYHNWPETYDWAAMPMEPDKPIEQLSQLMKDAGEAVHMEYTPWESGAHMNWTGHKLQSKFHYSPECQFITSANFSNDEWTAMLKGDLDKGNPVIYNGSGSGGNHAFIVDGYNNTGYHINWGWDGQCNGYFALDVLAPNDAQDFSNNTGMVFNIEPDRSGMEYSECFTDYGYFWSVSSLAPGCYISTDNVSNQNPFTFSCISCTLIENFEGFVGIGLVDKDNKIKEVIKSEYFSTWSDVDNAWVPLCYDLVYSNCTINSDIENSDRIQLISRGKNDNDWKLILGTLESSSYIPISALRPSLVKVDVTVPPQLEVSYTCVATGLSPTFTSDFSLDVLKGVNITFSAVNVSDEQGMIVMVLKGVGPYADEERRTGTGRVDYAFGAYGESYTLDIQFIKTGVEKTITLSEPGTLSSLISPDEALSISYLTINGKMNVHDFWFIRDNVSNLERLDITDVEIVGCEATDDKYVSFYPELPWTFADNCIPDWALTGLNQLSDLKLPVSVTAIASNSLMNLNLEKIVLPSGLENIGLNVLFDNTNLAIVELKNPNPIPVNDCVFTSTKCPENGLLFVPEGSKENYKNYPVWKDFKYIIEGEAPSHVSEDVEMDNCIFRIFYGSNEASLVGYNGAPVNIVVPENIEVENQSYTVSAIGDCAFENCTSLETVEMSDNITSMGYSAFSNCNSLKSVVLSKNLTEISSGAFYGTLQLEHCEMSENITMIGSTAFYDCGLTSFYIPQFAKYDNSAPCFGMNRRAVEYRVHPLNPYFKAVEGALYRVKENEIMLEAIPVAKDGYFRIMDGTTTILRSALDSKITTLYIPESVEIINTYSWLGGYTEGPEHIIFANTGSIMEDAFGYCPALEAITFEHTPKSYENMLSQDCTSLKHIFITSDEPMDLRKIFRIQASEPSVYIPAITPSGVRTNSGSIYVPGATADNYKDAYPNVKEMWTYKINKEIGALKIVPKCEGLVIDRVTINGKEIQPVRNVYTYAQNTQAIRRENSEGLDVKVEYTLHGRQAMTTHYDSEFNESLPSSTLTSIDEVVADSDAEVDVYGVDGALLMKGCDKAQLRQLAPGAYILRQGGRVVKTIVR